MFVEGVATLTLSSKSVGRLEAMYSSVKPLNVFSHTLEIAKPGKYVFLLYFMQMFSVI